MHNKGAFLDNYWVKMQTTAEYESWCGHAFEIICLHHINEIIRAFGYRWQHQYPLFMVLLTYCQSYGRRGGRRRPETWNTD